MDFKGFSAEKPILKIHARLLVEDFGRYVEAYDKNAPFTNEQLKAHRAVIRRRHELGSAAAASTDPIFARTLYDTLRAWGLGKRGSHLLPFPDFATAVASCSTKLAQLDAARLDAMQPTDQVVERVWDLLMELTITENKNRIVAGSKCLHHLLPNLVPPMDREYTQTFFGWHNPEFQKHSEECFKHALRTFAQIASAVQPEGYVGDGWRTSQTKVLDNAVVAFCRLNGLESSNRKRQRIDRVRFKMMVTRAKELGIWHDIESEATRRAAAKLPSTQSEESGSGKV